MSSNFEALFRQHVIPRLVYSANHQGGRVALDLISFSDAWSNVMDEARKYGALHMRGDFLSELDDWITARILEAVLHVDSLMHEPRARTARVAANAVGVEAQWLMMK